MATVLYHKNGVITEERFQKMNIVQWMFHYFEIMQFSTQDKKMFMESLEDIQTSIQAFYLLVDKQNGPKLIDTLIDIKKKRVGNKDATMQQKAPANQDNNNNDNDSDENLPDLLNDEDKELWSFMETLPETMIPGEGMTEERKPILPTRSKKDIIESQTRVVDKIENEERPKLGF